MILQLQQLQLLKLQLHKPQLQLPQKQKPKLQQLLLKPQHLKLLPAHRVIRPGGAFLVYQFSAKARDFMAKHFKHIDSGFELWNVLPCQLFWGWKD